MRATKKERSGLQSACDELIDKAAIHHRRIVGCMRPELGEFIQSSWAGRPAIAPSCRGPSMMLPDPRSLPHGLTHWVIVAQQSDRHNTWSTTARSGDEVVLIRDAVSHYAPVLIDQNSPRRRPWRARIFSIGEGSPYPP